MHFPKRATPKNNIILWSAINEETRDGDALSQLYSPLEYIRTEQQ